MAAKVEIIGVYPVDAPEPCHLIDLWVRGSEGPFKLEMFSQEELGQPRSNWQVPYEERMIDAAGSRIIAEPWNLRNDKIAIWKGDVRLVFFFHYLQLDAPLLTPFGSASLPRETPRPPRLDFMKYDPPR